jgi:peroxiredoxin
MSAGLPSGCRGRSSSGAMIADASRSAAPRSGTLAELETELVGRELPRLRLASTHGPVGIHELSGDRLVLVVYPHATGLPDHPVPDWDLIPGARGCTAQSCGFRDQHARLSELGAELAGLSVQAVDEQRDFAARAGLHYRLISDPGLALAAALGLPSFSAGGRSFYRRLTLIVESSLIVQVFDPVAAPAENANEVVRWLESRGREDSREGRGR